MSYGILWKAGGASCRTDGAKGKTITRISQVKRQRGVSQAGALSWQLIVGAFYV